MVENVAVTERADNLIQDLKKYITAVAAGECVDCNTKSFEVVKTALRDPLIVAKLHFMLSVGKQLQLFLVGYQTEAPMVTSMCTDLSEMIKTLVSRIVTSDVLKQWKDLIKVGLSKTGNLLDYPKVDVGFSADKLVKEQLHSKTVSERAVMEFRMESRSFDQAFVLKLQDKSHLLQLLRNCHV